MDNRSVFIKCDSCEGLISPKEITMERTKLNGITVEYFTCPSCGHKYIYKLTDSKQKLFDNQIAGYMELFKSRKRRGKNISSTKQKMLISLLDSSKEYQQVLRDKHLKAVTEQLNKIGLTETNSITGKEEQSHEE